MIPEVCFKGGGGEGGNIPARRLSQWKFSQMAKVFAPPSSSSEDDDDEERRKSPSSTICCGSSLGIEVRRGRDSPNFLQMAEEIAQDLYFGKNSRIILNPYLALQKKGRRKKVKDGEGERESENFIKGPSPLSFLWRERERERKGVSPLRHLEKKLLKP